MGSVMVAASIAPTSGELFLGKLILPIFRWYLTGHFAQVGLSNSHLR